MGSLAPILGTATGIIGGITGNNQAKADNATANQYAQQMQQVENQLQGNVTNLTNQYNQDYATLLPGLSSGEQSSLSAANQSLPQLITALENAGLDPSTISQLTGVNSQQLNQNSLSYLSNPSATNTSQVGSNVLQQYGNTSGTNLSSATPQAQGVFQQEMATGLNPQYQQNAINQVQQGVNQNIASLKANAQPGTNINGLLLGAQNAGLTAQQNLAGNLAGQSQQLQSQGAQSSLNAAGTLDAQKMNMLAQQLNAAGVIDTQTMNMLTQAAAGGQNINQQAYNNLGASTTAGNNALGQAQSFIGQGQGDVTSGYSALSGIAGDEGAMSQNAAKAAGAANAAAAASFGSAGKALGGLLTPQSTQQSAPVGDYSSTSTADYQYGPSATGYSPYSGTTSQQPTQQASPSLGYTSDTPVPQYNLSGSSSGSPTTPINNTPYMTPQLFQSVNYNPNYLA